MSKEKGWIVFFGPDGKEILRISRHGLCEGEIGSTVDLIAYERGWDVGAISFAEVSK